MIAWRLETNKIFKMLNKNANKNNLVTAVTDIEKIITQEVTKLLYKGCKNTTPPPFILAGILIYIDRKVVSVANLELWAVIFSTAYLLRFFIVIVTKHNALSNSYPIKYLNLYRFLTTLCGCSWGLASVLLLTNDISHQLFLTMILLGVCGGAAAAYFIDKISVLGFLGSIFLIVIPNFLIRGNDFSIAMAVSICSFIVFTLISSYHSGKNFIENITLRFEEQQSKATMNALSQRQRLHIEHTPLAVIEWDNNLNITFWNAAAAKMFGFDEAEAIGRQVDLIVTESHIPEVHYSLIALKEGLGGEHIQSENIRKNGQMIYCEWFNTVLHDSAGEVTGIASLIQDETAFIKAKEEIEQLAYYDALTKLANRRLLLNRLELALAKSVRKRAIGSIMFIDLDKFKILNDTYGHGIGDMLLCEVATRLKKVLRKVDTVARIGGDEFVLLLEDLSLDAAAAHAASQIVAEKVIESINEPFKLNQLTYHCTPSIGICMFDHLTETVEELIRRADIAMYQSKQAGRNNYHYYDATLQPKIEYKESLKDAMQTALAEQQFRLYFQPQVDGNRKIKGAETLLRWIHPKLGFISPAEFIPIAEESKLIIPIGNWVLLEACQQLKKWQRSAHTKHLTLSVNVSAIQFNQISFIEQVQFALKKSKCNPKLLTIELTESAVVQNFEDIIEKMHALKALGISLSMDDFGVGYSSLSVLKRLPLDELKIDRSFVSDLPDNQDSAVIAQTIIAMSHSLGLSIIAEGVETQAQADFLQTAGCADCQGYFFGKPAVIADFEKMMTV